MGRIYKDKGRRRGVVLEHESTGWMCCSGRTVDLKILGEREMKKKSSGINKQEEGEWKWWILGNLQCLEVCRLVRKRIDGMWIENKDVWYKMEWNGYRMCRVKVKGTKDTSEKEWKKC